MKQQQAKAVLSRVLEIDLTTWDTPPLHYPDAKVGRAEILHKNHRSGHFLMEGVDGYIMFHAKRPFRHTMLKIGGREWMNDNPTNYLGMKRLAEASSGDVLVGGLGLGMVTKALCDNPRVKSVTVVELDPDVVKLVGPLVAHPKLKIVNDDFLLYEQKAARDGTHFDTVVADIWVGEGSLHIWAEMMGAVAMSKQLNPNALVYIWGSNDPELNPAITKDKRTLDALKELKKEMRG